MVSILKATQCMCHTSVAILVNPYDKYLLINVTLMKIYHSPEQILAKSESYNPNCNLSSKSAVVI